MKPRERGGSGCAYSCWRGEAVRGDRRTLSYQGGALAESLSLAEAAGNQAAASNSVVELEKCDHERSRLSNQELALERTLGELEAKRNGLTSRLLREPWPGVVASASTDREGRFSLKAASDKAMVAVAEFAATTEGVTESCQWFVPITNRHAAFLLLDNGNVFQR